MTTRKLTPIPDIEGKEMFCERVRRLRVQAGLSQRQLATRVGVSSPCISSLETRQTGVISDLIMPLCRVFGVTADYLLSGRESPRVAALHRAILMSPSVDAKIVAMVRGQ